MGIGGKSPKIFSLKADQRRRGLAANVTEADSPSLTKVPPVPESIDDAAAERWTVVCRVLIRFGLLFEADLGQVESYCTAWSRAMKANKQLAKEGLTVFNDKGNEYANPLIAIVATAQEQMRKLGNDLGLTPTSRIRLVAPTSTVKSSVPRRERG